MRAVLAVRLTAAGLALVPAASWAAPIHNYGALAISADGRQLATLESKGERSVVTLRDAGTGRIVRTLDPCAKCSYAGLTFGPDGTLAFVERDRAAGTATLVTARGAAVHPVATIAGLASTPRFSPDGRRIALLVTLGAAKETGATQAGVRQIGEIGEHSDEQRLAVFDVGTTVAAAAVKPLSPADRYIYEYDWAPDGRTLVVTSALGNGDANWWVATLDAVDATTGAVRAIARPTTQINMPRVSPDGRTVAFIGGLMSDFGSIGGDVWTVPLAGGTPRDITQGQTQTFVSLDWPSTGLRAAALRGDRMGAVALGDGGDARTLFERPASLSAGDGRIAWSADGAALATVVQDFTHAPAVYAGPAAQPRQLTHDNDAAPAAVAARSVSWKNEGYTIQGWLLSPLGADPVKKAPMVVIVHGGPSAASTPRFIEHGAATAYLDAGYHMFLPNPRGSYGQGEAFTSANKRDFGGGDLRDILAGVDAVEKVAPIDDNRLALGGCSYGGFMAMWANTQTDRFKAIIAGAGLSNWVSYYGTNGIDTWMLPFFGKSVYQDYKAYEDASAVYHVKSAHTPTFIYVGERDIEVPPTQSIEWWRALRNQGVDSSLVIYPDAGHCVPDPTQQADVRARSLAWLGKYLAPAAAK